MEEASESNKGIQAEEIIVISSMYSNHFQQTEQNTYRVSIPSPETVQVSPLVLRWEYTEDYPSSLPIFSLEAEWLTISTYETLGAQLRSIYDDQETKSVIIHNWIEWLKDNAYQLATSNNSEDKEKGNKVQRASKETRKNKGDQKTMKLLEAAYGKKMDTAEIWSTYKAFGFDIESTISELTSRTKKSPTKELLSKLRERNEKIHNKSKGKETESKESKVRATNTMRTSYDVFNRIRWDPDLDKGEFIIGYEDRFVGIMESPFSVWENRDISQESFIPWHRVQYFKCKDKIVWDRRTKEDYIFNDQPASSKPLSEETTKEEEKENKEVEVVEEVKEEEEIKTKRTRKNYQTAAVLLPPKEIWEKIEQLRIQHDKSFVRWPPHINMLYPFVPLEDFPAAVETLHSGLKLQKPFDVHLKTFQHFLHNNTSTIWLHPQTEGTEIVDLQRHLESLFPQCNDLSKKSSNGFTPHLTVGQSSKNQAEGFTQKFQVDWNPLTFTVDSIYLLQRNGDHPFSTLYQIPFGGKEIKTFDVMLEEQQGLLRIKRAEEFSKNEKVHKGPARMQHITPSRFDPSTDDWIPAPVIPDANVNTDNLKVVTFNVLFDTYQPDLIFSKDRYPKLLEALQQTDADVICLQEVTNLFLSFVKKSDWIRKSYFLSDASGSTLNPYGVLILSRLPFRSLQQYQFLSKGFLLAEYLINNERVILPALHLTSDRSKECEKKRLLQLQDVFLRTKDFDHAILIGDFNFGDGPENEAVMWGSHVDVWKHLKPDSPGFTFDPPVNSIAAITTKSGISRRLDRIFVRSKKFKPQQVTLLGTESFSIPSVDSQVKVFLSDHFGLSATLQL